MRRLLVLVLGVSVLLAGWVAAPGAWAAGDPPDRSLPAPPGGTYEDPSTLTFLLLLAGLLALTVLVGGLAAREGLRADRRARAALLARD